MDTNATEPVSPEVLVTTEMPVQTVETATTLPKQKSNLVGIIIIGLLLVLILLVGIGILVVLRNQGNSNNTNPTITPTISQTITNTVAPTEILPTDANQILLTGVIRDGGIIANTGISINYNIKNVVNQITDLKNVPNNNKINGYFLIDPSNKSNEFIGKCVTLTGVIPNEWKGVKLGETLDRSAINVLSVSALDFTACKTTYTPGVIDTTKVQSWNGKIERENRPACDIGYDYKLTLTTPYMDNNNASGQPLLVKDLVMIPNTDALWKIFEQNINKTVEIKGESKGGYAESTYILVNDIVL
jgi:hypothetical protein